MLQRTCRRGVLLVLALCAFSPVGAAADTVGTSAGPRDLFDVYLRALEHNPGYQAQLARYRVAAETQPQARARLLPRLDARGEFSLVRQKVEGDFFGARDIDESDTFDRFSYSIALRQTVFRRDVFLGLDRAELEVGRAKLLVTGARHRLMLRAAEVYFAKLTALDNLRLVQAEKEAISRQLDQVQSRFDAGFVSEVDVKAVQAQLDAVLASEIEAENDLDIARTRIEFLTGDFIEQVQPFREGVPLPRLQPEDLDSWIARSQEHNLALLAQTVGVRVAEVDTEIARAQHLPNLDLVGSHVFFDADGGVSGSRRDQDSRIGLVLSVPIFEGGGTQSRVRQAQARADAEVLDEQEARAEARLQTRTAYLNARAARSRADALVRAVESARAAEDASEVGFEVGSRTAAEYLATVRERYRAERDLSQARYQYVLNLLRLRQAAGVLTVADLQRLNDRLRSP